MLIPLILSGGTGTRLWPVSREGHPKPFLQLADGESLLQKTLQRAAQLDDIQRILVLTNRDYYFQSKDEAVALDGFLERPPTVSYLLEPQGRNTLPAIALGALALQKQYGNDALILVLSADHLINNQEAFASDVAIAAAMARRGYLVTFGIPAHTPETGFGYLERGENLGDGAFRVGRFIEKPPLSDARRYVTSGQHFWNAGMFCFSTEVLLQELATHQPEFLAQARAAWGASQAGSSRGDESTYLAEAEFSGLPNISIDYGLMELSSRVAMVPASFDWNDIGSWDALAGISPKDEQGNSHAGDVVMIASQNCHVRAEERLVAALGVKDLFIVETADAVLVADREHAQQVKDVVGELKSRRHTAALLHVTVVRPWGSYTVLEENPGFKIKRIEVKSNASLSLQLHRHRSEHWVVVSGQAQVINDDKTLKLGPNESTYIPAGHRHRLKNVGDTPLVVIEVQCGPYLGEDDIVRFEDNYGRQGQ